MPDNNSISGGVNLTAQLVAKFESKGEDALRKKLEMVRQEVEATGKVLEKMASGMDFSRYYNTAASTLDGVAAALRNVRDAGDDVDVRSMQELIRSVNAFQASAKIRGEDPSRIFTEFGQELKTAYESAKAYMPQFAQLWSVDEFESAFKAMSQATELFGREMGSVFEKVNSADLSGYRRMCSELRSENEKLKSDIAALKEELESIGAGNGSKLQKQIESLQSRLRDVTAMASNEFAEFLRGNELSQYDDRFTSLFESIRSGSMTAREAIAQCKYEFSHLFEGQNDGLAERLISRFEEAARSIEDLRSQIVQMRNDLAMAGIGSGEGNFERTVSEETRAIREEGEAISELKAHTEGLGETVDLIRRLSEHLANAGNGTGAQAIADSLTQMMSALQDFANVDGDKLTTISSALFSIQNMNGFKANGKSLAELTNMLSTLSGIEHSGTSVLDRLSAIKFDNLQGLKVSKAALENLRTYLPEIANINVDGLQAIANINWEHLNNLHITKENVANLAELASATNVGDGRTGTAAAQNAFIKIGDTLGDLKGKIAETFNLEPAIEQAERLTQAYSEVRGALELVRDIARAAQAQVNKAQGGSGGSTDKAKESIEATTEAIERQTQAWYDDQAAWREAQDQMARDDGWAQADALAKREAAEQAAIERDVAAYEKGAQAKAAAAEAASTKATAAWEKQLAKYEETFSKMQAGSSGVKFGDNAEAVSRYSAAIESARTALEAIKSATEENRDAAVNAFKQEVEAVRVLRDELNGMYGNMATGKQIEAFKKQWTTFTQTNTTWYSDNKAAYDDIWAKISSGAQLSADELRDLQTQFMQMNNAMAIARAGGKSFFDEMKAGWRKFGGWSIVTRSFTMMIRVMKQAVSAVKEVDAAMVELRKVTQLTEQQYNDFFNAVADSSKKIGSSMSDMINATADFARLGYEINDATKLAEAASIYMNVGDKIESMDDATTAIISTMKAFGIEAEHALTIVDKYNEVGKELLPMPVVTRCLVECYIGQSSIALCA